MAIEEEFGVEIPDAEADEITTVQQGELRLWQEVRVWEQSGLDSGSGRSRNAGFQGFKAFDLMFEGQLLSLSHPWTLASFSY